MTTTSRTKEIIFIKVRLWNTDSRFEPHHLITVGPSWLRNIWQKNCWKCSRACWDPFRE